MNNKGFTLIEIMISVTLFSVLIVAVLGIFDYSVKAHEKMLNSQEILNQTSYIMEYMSRSLRMAQKDMDGSCIGVTNKTYINTDSDTAKIKFINYNNKCQEFYLDNGILKEKIGSSVGVPLISSEFKVNSINFEIKTEDGAGNKTQPRITTFLDIETDTQDTDKYSQIKIQTTVSQRNLSI